MDIFTDEPSTSSCSHQDDEEGKNKQLFNDCKMYLLVSLFKLN